MKELALLVAVVWVIGCSAPTDNVNNPQSSGAPTGGAAPAANTTRHTLSSLVIDLPKSWVTVDLTSGERDKAFEEASKAHPNVAKNLDAIKTTPYKEYITLVSFDADHAKDGFTPNLNIIEAPVPAGTTEEQLIASNKAQFSSVTKAPIKEEAAAVKGGKLTSFEWTAEGSTVKGGLHLLSYIGLHNSKQLVFTFTCTESQATEFFKAAKEAMKTVELK